MLISCAWREWWASVHFFIHTKHWMTTCSLFCLTVVTFRWHKLCSSKSKELLSFSWLRIAWQFYPCVLTKSSACHRDSVFLQVYCSFVLLFLYFHNQIGWKAVGLQIKKKKNSNKISRYPDSPYTWIICACRPGCIWMKITRNSPDSWNLWKETSPLLVW